MKFVADLDGVTDEGPTPHGVGGLKFPSCFVVQDAAKSHPSRGGWIEIAIDKAIIDTVLVPPLTGWVD